MDIISIRDYFRFYILVNNIDTDSDNHLTPKEIDVFIEFCILNSNGVNLSNLQELWKSLKGTKLLTRINDVSGYKTSLAAKGWIKGKRNLFLLPKHLDILIADDGFLVWKQENSNWKRVKVKKLVKTFTVSVEFKKESDGSDRENREADV